MAQAAPKRRERSPRQLALSIGWYVVLAVLTVVFVAPLLWMLSTSLKTRQGSTQFPLTWIPRQISLEGFNTIFNTSTQTPVLRWFLNSLIAASGHTLIVLVTASLAGYALARMRFPGRNVAFAVIIGTLFIPQFVFLMPNYLIVDYFGWLDTLLAVAIPGTAGAFGVFFLRQFFLSLPKELEEAALIDGANRFQIFLRVILPLSKAPLATLAVLSFLTNWNDFLWPIYVLISPGTQTLPPGLAILQNAYSDDFPVVMAGGVLASIPVLILFFIAQRYI